MVCWEYDKLFYYADYKRFCRERIYFVNSTFFRLNHGDKAKKIERQKGGSKRYPPVLLGRIQLVILFFFLRNYFFTIIKATVLANSVRFTKFVAMRAFNQRRCRCCIVCESLIRSALRLFCLRYCHIYTSRFKFFQFLDGFSSEYRIPAQFSSHKSTYGILAIIASSSISRKSILPFE